MAEDNETTNVKTFYFYTLLPEEGGGILFYLCPSFRPSVQDIFRRINC